jgi:predicted nucleotidyltransferase
MPKDAVAPGTVHHKFTAALESLVEQIQRDRSILAAILCGSLSHDKVWDKSDIDLVLVTVDEKQKSEEGVSLSADGINVHAFLTTRAEFRKMVEGAVHNSFTHSFFAKGKLLYTHDQTIATLCERLHTIGDRDNQVQLLRAGAHALPSLYKARKWWITRRDLEYTALWILYAATPLARIEVLNARQLADREVLPQAILLNPAFFKMVYTDLLNTKKTAKNVEAALLAAEQYIRDRIDALFAAVIDHLREVGEARSATEIEDYFRRNMGVEGITGVCEYLADEGLLGKAQVPVRLTKRSNVQVQELAFYYINLEPPPDEW